VTDLARPITLKARILPYHHDRADGHPPKVSIQAGRSITIVPKLSPDELQDERDISDPKTRATIRKGNWQTSAMSCFRQNIIDLSALT
jgi:hypothetical protein